MLASSFLLTLCASVAIAANDDPARQTIKLDSQWRFHLGDVENGQEPAFDDAAWRELDVPHDWAIEGTVEMKDAPLLNVVAGPWRFHKGDKPEWKKPELDEKDWETVALPALWNDHSHYNDQNCYGWYRRRIEIPAALRNKPFLLVVGKIDDADETYLNGKRIGATGHMPPHYASAWDVPRMYKVNPKLLNDGENVIAIRVYNGEGKGGLYDAGPSKLEREGPFNRGSLAGDGGGYLDGGIGWYRRKFTTPDDAKGKRVWIEFDGAYMDSQVWINGQLMGRHPYGYTSFYYDITSALKPSGDNVVAVRLDVSQPCSRWYSGAGLFRHVRLTTVDAVHIGHWGTYVTTPKIGKDDAEVRIRTTYNNESSEPVELRLVTTIFGPDATLAATAKTPAGKCLPGAEASLDQTLHVPKPELWSLDKPKLYTAVVSLWAGDRCLDTVDSRFGIRSFEFTIDKGFFLNGEHVSINGVCDHHDLGCLGSAVNRRAIERQLEILRGFGCNAIRTSHNPPEPMLLDLCDKMGFLVMDEAFDEWKQNKTTLGYGRFFDQWSEPDIVSMLHRDRNHPCIILWSIGNEIPEQGASNGGAMAKRLADICRREDPTRPTTAACHTPDAADRSGFAKALGVVGINYNTGAYNKYRGKYKLIGSETSSAVSSRGEYGLKISNKGNNKGKVEIDKLAGNQVTSYDLYAPSWAYTAEHDLVSLAHSPWVAGEFVWTGFDYIGEPTPFSWPSRSSYFGIVDLAGFPKDRYYMYRSIWKPDEALVHILPHWNWPGFEGKPIPVWVITNCDSVELFLNDKSLGEKQLNRDKSLHVEFDVPYTPGVLRAVGKHAGQEEAKDEVRTAGSPARLAMQADRSSIAASDDDLSFVTVSVLDKDGIICPNADSLVRFQVTGPGAIAGLDNGDAINHEPFQGQQHKVFHGLGLAVIKPKGEAGKIVLHAEADGLSPAEVEIETH
jgi:beta-galactosidase